MTITQRKTPNFHTGRGGHVVLGVVIHCEEGTEAATDSWFESSKSSVSAHYAVMKNGEVRQFVQEEDTAWHAGRVDHPTAQLVLDYPGVNPNLYLIGIEHEGDGSEDLTDAQRATTLELLAAICQRHNIPIDRDHIVGHHEIYSVKRCPDAIDVDRLVSQLQDRA